MFDNYEHSTVKDSKQKRRQKKQSLHHPDVVINEQTPAPTNTEGFLSNKHNKQGIIYLIEPHLKAAGIVIHAIKEGDADTTIVKQAVHLSSVFDNVVVHASDTDILIMLIFHADASKHIFMQTQQQTFLIKDCKEVLSREMCMCLPFAHCMSGCDTTSALFGLGKIKILKLMTSRHLGYEVLIFGDTGTTKEVITAEGEN